MRETPNRWAQAAAQCDRLARIALMRGEPILTATQRVGAREDYIPPCQFAGGASKWLAYERARQERLGVVTGQLFRLTFHGNVRQDQMIPIQEFEHAKKFCGRRPASDESTGSGRPND